MYKHLTSKQKTRLKMLISSFLPFTITTLFLLTLSILKHPQLLSFTHSTPAFHIHRNLLQTQTAQLHCEGVLYPTECVETLTQNIADLHEKSLPEILSATVNQTVTDVRDAEYNVTVIRKKLQHLTPLENRALDDCFQLFDQTVFELKLAAAKIAKSPTSKYHDLQTLLSAAMTNQDTCLDGFVFSKYRERVRKYFEHALRKISRQVSNSLSLLKKINGTKTKGGEVFPEYGTMSAAGYPAWLKKKDRTLLQAPVNASQIDLVVAQDGSGNYTTIGDALTAAPNNSATRFVIYIKTGAYYEYLEVINKKMNVMFLGDGIGKTLIKGNRSVIDGWTTFRSSTVAVVGSGFIAKGITFENYAGPEKHQAVAVRSGSDFSAFYQCSFIGYQDTLYVHSLRQFYRECNIYGTVDFIFGNAAVVFQNSNLYARKPLDNQQNIFTAQGRDDPNQNTGISILNCKVAAGSELLPNITFFRSFLGRPWKNYSRTVVMKSKIEEVIDPKGWLEWDGNASLSTLYYGEYMNRGAGSNTSSRVTWPGYRVINSSTEALQFTVEPFIQGGEFLNNTGIPFFLGLTT